MNIYVGNFPYETSQSDLEGMFGEFGEVESVSVITDRQTGRSRGFGFVVMANDDEANAAIEALNEKDIDGRPLKVNQAKERSSQGGGGGGGGRGGRGGGGGGGRGGYGGGGGGRGGGGGGRNRY